MEAGTLPLPKRVRDLIATRLDRLSERARDIASMAAVIGREFDFELLQRASGLDEYVTAEGVEELVRHCVLRGVGERFDFSHNRVQAVVYNRLLSPQRRVRHRRVGEALEAIHAANVAPHYVTLGTHFREGEVWDKAVTYFRKAADRALARSAYAEGARLAEQAIEALARLPETGDTIAQAIDLRFILRDALAPLGQYRTMLNCLHEASVLAETLGDRRRLGLALASLSMAHRLIPNMDRAVEVGKQAVELATELADPQLQVAATHHLGQAFYFLGDLAHGADYLKQSLRISMRSDPDSEPPTGYLRHARG